MILRVRSNLGTAKLEIDDQEKATESTIRARILEDLRCKTSSAYKLTQDLSFDPAGVVAVIQGQQNTMISTGIW